MAEVPQTSALTATEQDLRPGQETAPVFASSRDFDGGLLSRWQFTLTHADALAYLRLKREVPGWAKWALGAWFIAGGAVFGLLPETVTGTEGTWQKPIVFGAVIAVQFAILLLGRAAWRQIKARRMIATPLRGEFEEWIDCIAGTDILCQECAYLSPELIGQVVDTPTHIFVLNSNTAIVVPKHAFASPAEADAMAAHIRKLAAGPYYFEAQDNGQTD
jgi:hypothetical protein